jgi:F-type H+-transporting ATPase subunit epsilon
VPLQVELVSPERVIWSGEAAMVIARTPDGELAFQPGHVPFLGALQGHELRIWLDANGQQVKRVAVHSGFVQVYSDRVSVLSDMAELSEEIDVPRARAARDRALHTLAQHPDDGDAQGTLDRAEVRLKAAGVQDGSH